MIYKYDVDCLDFTGPPTLISLVNVIGEPPEKGYLYFFSQNNKNPFNHRRLNVVYYKTANTARYTT